MRRTAKRRKIHDEHATIQLRMGASQVDERALRRYCRRELRALEITAPLDVSTLLARLGARRGRPIELVPFPLPVPGPYGLWMAGRETDYIAVQADTTRAHQDHIVLHEVGHMLAGHDSDEGDDAMLRELFPSLGPEAIRRTLRRYSYDEQHEFEAELVATIILEWASVADEIVPLSSDSRLRRMEAAFGEKAGWL